jgi:peptidoglycan/xylan/chitin deacetylase (PgdA/CDA1 family)
MNATATDTTSYPPVAVNGAEMTRPEGMLAYAKHLVLRGGLDRVRPLAYSRSTGGVRCLTFHYLFEQELDKAYGLFRTLKSHGDFITTPELLELLDRPRQQVGRLFHLSIDDGFDNIACNAHAILRELSIPYTFFVCPDLVDGGPDGDEQFRINAGYRRRLPLASWKTLRILADDGVEIGSHTATHRSVSSLASEANLDAEIVRSKATIEARLARPCTSFAWPFGRIDAMTPSALAKARTAGYTALFSSVRGSLAAGGGSLPYLPRHHFEPSWPEAAVVYYATRQEKSFTPDPRLST